MSDFYFLNHNPQFQLPPMRMNMNHPMSFTVHTANGPILSRMQHETLERGPYREYLHDGQWSESMNPEIARMERHVRAEEDDVIKIAGNKYKHIPYLGCNGFDPCTNSAREFTTEQKREWRALHAHCGDFSERQRAKIIMQMQTDFNCSAEDFHDTIEMHENNFRQKYAPNIRLPTGYDDWLPHEQSAHFSETRLPANTTYQIPGLPPLFQLWSRQQQLDWYEKHGDDCL
jgi:hypothetical protein